MQPFRQAYYKLLQELLIARGQSADLYAILAPQCYPYQTPERECRKSAWVKFYVDALQSYATVSTLPDINDCDLDDLSLIDVPALPSVPGGAGSFAALTATGVTTLNGNLVLDKTVTPIGTTGNVTINKNAGTANMAIGALTLTVTNSRVTATSIVLVTIQAIDTTLKTVVADPGAGSFVITGNANATAATPIGFLVIN